MEIQKIILKICMEKGFLLDKEILQLFSNLDEKSAKELIESLDNLKTKERVITKAFFSKNFEKIKSVLVDGESRTIIEKLFINLGYSREEIQEKKIIEIEELDIAETHGKVKVLSSSIIEPKKVSVKDFVDYFRVRYNQIKGFLEARDLDNLTSIRKIGNKRESFTIIAAVLNKRLTKNKNLLIEVEDLSGKVVVLVNQNKKEIFEKAKDLLLDDIVAFYVSGNSEILFANDIIYPDCFLQEKKRCNQDEWVAFSSDLHVGSNMFLERNFLRFIKWLNGGVGDEKQKDIAKKVRYLLLAGDNVDGVGVYPDQERFLEIKDITKQYERLAELLKLIRKDIKIIMCPGQHDAVWVGVPQPIIGEEYALDLHKIENLVLVTNPSLIEIDGDFKVLMYHGASMSSIVDEIESLRLNYGHDFPTKTAIELLKRRHLAPMHGSVDYIPDGKKDSLVIEQIPDILTTGDWHRPEVSMYNNILLVASSCWQSLTPFEEKVGNHPDPCKVPLFNLKTREIKILDFSEVEEEVEEVICEEERKKGKEIICEVKT